MLTFTVAGLRLTPSLLYFLAVLPAFVPTAGQRDGKTVIYIEQFTLRVVLEWVGGFCGVVVALLYAMHPSLFQLGQFMPQIPALVACGGVIAAAGMGLACWSKNTLGNNWVGGVFLRNGHALVTRGPYRVVRHPLYVGFAIFHIGLLVATGSVVLLLTDGLWRALLMRRAFAEEQLLAERFGQPYLDYKAHTGMFLPKFRRR